MICEFMRRSFLFSVLDNFSIVVLEVTTKHAADIIQANCYFQSHFLQSLIDPLGHILRLGNSILFNVIVTKYFFDNNIEVLVTHFCVIIMKWKICIAFYRRNKHSTYSSINTVNLPIFLLNSKTIPELKIGDMEFGAIDSRQQTEKSTYCWNPNIIFYNGMNGTVWGDGDEWEVM